MQNHYTFYKATNKKNGKVYIGMTSKTIQERIQGHKRAMSRPQKSAFVRALEQYEINGFEWKEISTAKKYYTALGQDYDRGEYEAKGFEMELIKMAVEIKGRENVYNEITSWQEYYERNPAKKRQWSKYKPVVIEKPVIVEKPVVVTKEVVKEVEKPVIVEKKVVVEKPVERRVIVEKPIIQQGHTPQPAHALPAPNNRILSPMQIALIVIIAVVCASLIFVFAGGESDNIDADIQFSTCREAKQAGYQDLTLQQVREFGIDTYDGDDDGVYCE